MPPKGVGWSPEGPPATQCGANEASGKATQLRLPLHGAGGRALGLSPHVHRAAAAMQGRRPHAVAPLLLY
eukprot:8223051-Alexandrium_andersonii.AAC.1